MHLASRFLRNVPEGARDILARDRFPKGLAGERISSVSAASGAWARPLQVLMGSDFVEAARPLRSGRAMSMLPSLIVTLDGPS